MYLVIRQAHGVYVSFMFVKWAGETGYYGLKWVASFIPVPYKELGNKEMYYEIETLDNDFILIKNIS
tara:strand:+ start:1081 stop:1281 length:201 start_codon:yes stop_codon:yes gene_type:complete